MSVKRLGQHENRTVSEFFGLALNGLHPHFCVRAGVGVVGINSTVRAVFVHTTRPLFVHVVCPVNTIYHCKREDWKQLIANYRQLVGEVQSFMASHVTVKANRTCPCCGSQGLSLFASFSPNTVSLAAMGCRVYGRFVERYAWENSPFIRSNQCNFYHLIEDEAERPSFPIDNAYHKGEGAALLGKWANFLLGMANSDKQLQSTILSG